jgi:hypothetical protein
MIGIGDGIALAMGGPVGLAVKRGWGWLGAIPWQAWAAIAAMLVCWGFGHVRYEAGRHSRDPEVAGLQHVIAGIRTAQVAADKTARANQAAKAAAHVWNNRETIDAVDQAHAGADRIADALRLRIAGLERAARARPVPGASGAASSIDAAVDPRLPLADELALREQCDAVRIDHDALIDWETRRLAIELAPQPGGP